MTDSYRLSKRQAIVCRAAAVLFSVSAVVVAIGPIVPFALGDGGAVQVRCDAHGCTSSERIEQQLPDSERPAVVASAATLERFAAYARQAWVRALLVLINLCAVAPFALLMFFIARAVWRLGDVGADAFARALPWLRRGSFAALAATFVAPIADSVRAMLLMPGTPSGPSWFFAIDIVGFATNLLLACAAYIVTWALSAGDRARRDIAEFV